MKKITSFILGTVIGGAAGFLAGSLLVTDNQIDELKQKVKNNETVQDLKKKYDNGTEIVKNQLSSFPKDVDDDSEIKDFDDIVIDNSSDDSSIENHFTDSVDDLQNAEKPADFNNQNELNHPEDKVIG
jgi:gas vesicle protein